jgi:triphosphatase
MHEIELKFQVSPAQRGAVDAAVVGRAGRTAATRTRLQAAYHDTPERTLAQAGLALRMRREDRRWVQTLKGATDDGMTRLEHNVPRGSTAPPPPIDMALHAGTPAGAALQACLASGQVPTLTEVYRTDVLRRTRALRTPHGRVELAFDTGRITAGERHIAVLELEIELLAGTPRAVLDTARTWLPRFGLWLDVRSKAERGDLLARGETIAPARLAASVRLAPEMSLAMARRAVLRSCADQILANASQIASGEHASEHVHQLRVGLRRLRSALQLFEPVAADAALAEAAAVLFRRLGAARDQVVIDAEFGAELRAAMHNAGVTPEPVTAVASNEPSPTEVVRATESQRLLLDLLAATQTDAMDEAGAADAPEPAVALREQLAKCLNRWHRQLVADVKRFTELDDASRHQLRKRAKRLRYASEFCGALFEPRALRRYLKRLRALQERLGALSDVLMAMQSFAQQRDRDPAALFALGWLAARREVLIAAAAPELKAFAKVERFWKRG